MVVLQQARDTQQVGELCAWVEAPERHDEEASKRHQLHHNESHAERNETLQLGTACLGAARWARLGATSDLLLRRVCILPRGTTHTVYFLHGIAHTLLALMTLLIAHL